MTRMRSPNYPSLSLMQAVDMVAKIHRANRTNVITREDAALAMGYSGLTGRSMTVLGALGHFGLLSREGKGDVKVTATAVDILYADDDREKREALLKAAYTPQLFRDIHERFPDGVPSENSIKSFLIKQEFSDAAIGPAIAAFMATYREVENLKEGESYGQPHVDAPESPEQSKEIQMQQSHMPAAAKAPPLALPINAAQMLVAYANGIPELNKVNMDIRGDTVLIGGHFDLKGLTLLEKKVTALKALLALNADDDDDGSDAPGDDEADDYLEAKGRI